VKKRNSINTISKFPLSKKGVFMMLGATLGAIPMTTVLPTDAEATPAEVTVSVGSVSGNPGDIVYVPVSIDTLEENVGYYNLFIAYDSEKLEILTDQMSTPMVKNERSTLDGEFTAMNLWDGFFSVSWGTNIPYMGEISSNGPLFTIPFKIKENAPSGEAVIIIDSMFSDGFKEGFSHGPQLSVVYNNTGTVTINEANTNSNIFSIGTVSAKAGQEVDIPVSISGVTSGIGAYGAQKIEFDPAKLEVVSITQNHGTPEEFQSNFNNTEGWLGAAWVDSTGGDRPITADLTLFNVRFKIKDGTAVGDAELTLNTNVAGNLELTAVDGTNLAASLASGTVTVLANVKPTILDILKSINEDEPLTFTAEDFSSKFDDADGDLLAAIKIETLPANGQLKLDGVNVTVGQVIAAGHLGNLTFNPDANWNGNTSFTWQASDDIDYTSNSAAVHIAVNAVNDAPVVDVGQADVKVEKQEDIEKIELGVEIDLSQYYTDAEQDSLTSYKITELPEHGKLIRAMDQGRTVELAAGAEIPANEMRHVQFIPDQDWYGTTAFKWKVSDGTAYSDNEGTYTITITPVNDVPVMSLDTAGTQYVKAGGQLQLTGTITDVDSTSLSVKATINGVEKTAAISNNQWTLTWSAAELGEGTYDNIAVTAADGAGGTDEIMFADKIKVDVTAPVITLEKSTSHTTNQYVAIGVSASDHGTGIAEKKYALGTNVDFSTEGTPFTGILFNAYESGTYSVWVKDHAGNETVETISVDIDTSLESFTLTASPTDVTNGDVIITISDLDADVQMVKWAKGIQHPQYFASAGTLITNEPKTFTVSENGTYTVYVEDHAGNKKVQTIMISNLLTDAEAVSNVKAALEIGYAAGDSMNSVTQNVTLPAAGLGGTAIAWKSSNEAVMSAEGEVSRPNYLEGNKTVTLTATITKGSAVETKQFVLVVLEQSQTDMTSPVLHVEVPNVPTNQTVNISVEAEDTESGVHIIKWAPGNVDAAYFENYGNPISGTGDFEVDRNGEYTIYARDYSGNIQIKLVEVRTIDTDAPMVVVTPPNDWTKDKAVLSVDITDQNNDIIVQKYALGQQQSTYFANDGINITDSTFEVSANGTYTVYAKDRAGNETVTLVSVSQLDQAAPTVQVNQSEANPTNNRVTIGVDAQDRESGIVLKKWVKGNYEVNDFPAEAITLTETFFHVTENGVYSIYVKDAVGNITVQTINITNIDTGVGSFTLTPSTTVPTNGDVSIAVEELDSDIEMVKWAQGVQYKGYFEDNGTEITGNSRAFIVSDNGTYTVYVKDGVGNEAVKTIHIDNIDKMVPKVVQAAVLVEDAQKLRVRFDEEMDFNGTSGITVSIDGETSEPVSAEMGATAQEWLLSLNEMIAYGQSVTLSYDGNGAIKDKAGNSLAAFSHLEIENEVDRTDLEQQVYAAVKAVEKAELFKSMTYVNKAQELLDGLPSEHEEKAGLQERLDEAREEALSFIESADLMVFDLETVKAYIQLGDRLMEDLGEVTTEETAELIADRYELLKEELMQFENGTTGRYEVSIERAQLYVDENQHLIDSIEDSDVKTAMQLLTQKMQSKIDAAVEKRNRIQKAVTAVEKAEGSASEGDLAAARVLVDQLEDGAQKTDLHIRLDEVQRMIDERNAAHQGKAQAINEAIQKIASLPSNAAVTYADRDKVAAARAKAEQAFAAGAVEADIPNLAMLEAAEFKIDLLASTLPLAQIEYVPSQIADGTMTVSIKMKEQGSAVIEKKWLKGSKGTNDFAEAGDMILNDTFDVEENGIYTLYMKDEAGNEVVQIFVVDYKPYEVTGTLTAANGLKATASITLKDNAVPVSGSTYVVFQLMKGSTPVSVVVIEKTLQTTESVSAYFNVTGADYSVLVHVLDQELSDQNDVGRSLADSKTLTIQK
jgi:hypothetical protein